MSRGRHSIAALWSARGYNAAMIDRPLADVLTGDSEIDNIIRKAFARACRARDEHRDNTQEAARA